MAADKTPSLAVERRISGDGERVEYGVDDNGVWVVLNAVLGTWFDAAAKDVADAEAADAASTKS